MNIPENYLFAKTHEWVKVLPNGNVLVGISDHAQELLSDIVFINLGEEGEELSAKGPMGEVESVKAVSEVYSPVSGTIVKVNQDVLDSPETVNSAPYDAWFVELENVSGQEELLSPPDYEKLIAEEN